MLVTQDKIASPLLVLSSRFGAILCSAGFLLFTEGRVSLGAPLHDMAAFALSNETSTWAGYEMQKYVSFPVSVMAKSVKMLPSMAMGRVVNGTRYTLFEWFQASAALVCVCMMQMSDSGRKVTRPSKGPESSETLGFYPKLGMGILLLVVFFVCDGFTSQWQKNLYRKHPNLTQTQMMLGGNLLGFLLTGGTVLAAWPKVQASFHVAAGNPAIMCRIMCLGIVYALGQFCIYSAIRIVGPLTFSWIMTGRQLLSVLISLVFFGHDINVTKVSCILVCFGIMSAKQLAQIASAAKRAFLPTFQEFWEAIRSTWARRTGAHGQETDTVVLPMAMKTLGIVGALQGSLISYGILKEMLVTQDQIASQFLVLSSRLGAVICSVAFLLVTEGRVRLGAPLHAMAAFGLSNETSTWAGYEMLKYVSFPVSVMAKSVKMLPSMAMGRIVNGTRYTLLEWFQASAALVCVCMMQMSDSGRKVARPSKGPESSETLGFSPKLGT